VATITADQPYRSIAALRQGRGMASPTPARPQLEHLEPSDDVFPDDQLVIDLARSLSPRLPQLADADLEPLVRSALEELAPVRVTAYLAVLVERRLRGQFLRQTASSR
jgi:hypothetical protein